MARNGKLGMSLWFRQKPKLRLEGGRMRLRESIWQARPDYLTLELPGGGTYTMPFRRVLDEIDERIAERRQDAHSRAQDAPGSIVETETGISSAPPERI